MSEPDILAALAACPSVGSLWRHHKGRLYQVVTVGWWSENGVPMVGYRRVKEEHEQSMLLHAEVCRQTSRLSPFRDWYLEKVLYLHTLADWQAMAECDKCLGNGKVIRRIPDSDMTAKVLCGHCHGTGTLDVPRFAPIEGR